MDLVSFNGVVDMNTCVLESRGLMSHLFDCVPAQDCYNINYLFVVAGHIIEVIGTCKKSYFLKKNCWMSNLMRYGPGNKLENS